MSFPSSLASADLGRYFKVVQEAVDIRSHYELLQWLQGDLQSFLPHEIMIAAWGDFHLGLIRHDIVSNLPGIRTDHFSPQHLHPCLIKMFNHWISADKKTFSLAADKTGVMLGENGIECELGDGLKEMRSTLIHGISDERGRHDCLYAMLSTQAVYDERAENALQIMLPYIDTALRQVAPPVRQGVKLQPQNTVPGSGDELLSLREMEIMNWVRMGKTNSEIGQILDISAFTVKNHMQRIFKKLGAYNRTQAVTKFESTLQGVRS